MRRLEIINWLLMPDPFYLHLPNIINHQHTKESEKLVFGCGCMCRNNKEITISTAVCYF